MRVLMVEDHVELADDIADGLRDRGIATDIAYDGAAALQKGLVNRYDVIVLDRDVPKVHGDAVCLARRAPASVPVLVHGDLALDRARRRATRGGAELSLTRKELGVLEVLLAAEGAVVSAEQLLERVWDENADPFTRTVTVTLGRLRRKLGAPDPIETVPGAGYRLR